MRDRVLHLRTGLTTAYAVLSCSDVFLGIDSCHLHAADLMRIPGVALFGCQRGSTPQRWGYYFGDAWHVVCFGDLSLVQRERVLALWNPCLPWRIESRSSRFGVASQAERAVLSPCRRAGRP